MDGWIKVHRELLDKAIWRTSTVEQKAILITILLMANHKPNEWEWQGKRFSLQGGQFITSQQSLAKCAGVSIQNVKTALKRFEKYEFLTDNPTNSGRLISVVNWEHYQQMEDTPNRQPNQPLTDSQPTTNQALTTNKNVKNDKNERMKDINQSSQSSHPVKADGQDATDPTQRIDGYTDLIKSNIDYESLQAARPYDMPMIDEFIAVMLDVLMTDSPTIRIGGEDKPRELARRSILLLDYEDIEHTIDQLRSITGRITNKRQYITTLLYNCKMERCAHTANAVNAARWEGKA